MRCAVVAALSMLVVTGPVSGEPAPNLYEWMGVAPLVVAGRVVTDDQRHIEIEVLRTLRGAAPSSRTVHIDVRAANREREPGRELLRMERGRSYLVLLRPDARRRAPFGLVRGIDGVRELPAEGGEALLRAAERLAAVQALGDDTRVWRAFREMLEDTSPILLDTAVQMLLKFRRGDPQLLPAVHPLLAYPLPHLRSAVARLVAQIAERYGPLESAAATGLLSDLVAMARRDPAVQARVAATAALGALGDPSTAEVLREVAREDPDQAVRYEAERILHEQRTGQAPAARRIDSVTER